MPAYSYSAIRSAQWVQKKLRRNIHLY